MEEEARAAAGIDDRPVGEALQLRRDGEERRLIEDAEHPALLAEEA